MRRNMFIDAIIWVALAIQGFAAALQGAVAVLTHWNEPSLPFATDPCADGLVLITSIFLLPIILVLTALIISMSFIAERTRLRKAAFALVFGHVVVVSRHSSRRLAHVLAMVRAAWARSIDEEPMTSWHHWGPSMPIRIGDMPATLQLLERNEVR